MFLKQTGLLLIGNPFVFQDPACAKKSFFFSFFLGKSLEIFKTYTCLVAGITTAAR